MIRTGRDHDHAVWEVWCDGERLERCLAADDAIGWAAVDVSSPGGVGRATAYGAPDPVHLYTGRIEFRRKDGQRLSPSGRPRMRSGCGSNASVA